MTATSESLYSMAAVATDLMLYKTPLTSAGVFAAGLVWFFFLSALGYSSLAVVSFLALVHLLARFAYAPQPGAILRRNSEMAYRIFPAASSPPPALAGTGRPPSSSPARSSRCRRRPPSL